MIAGHSWWKENVNAIIWSSSLSLRGEPQSSSKKTDVFSNRKGDSTIQEPQNGRAEHQLGKSHFFSPCTKSIGKEKMDKVSLTPPQKQQKHTIPRSRESFFSLHSPEDPKKKDTLMQIWWLKLAIKTVNYCGCLEPNGSNKEIQLTVELFWHQGIRKKVTNSRAFAFFSYTFWKMNAQKN